MHSLIRINQKLSAQANWNRTAAGRSRGLAPERRTAAGLDSGEVRKRIEALERERSALLPQYYAAKNEATLRRMEGDGALKSLYAQAKGLREDLDRAGLVETGTGTENGEAYRAAWDGLKEKYGVSRAAELPALHERLLREFGALEEQLAAQGVDYEYLRAYEQMAEDRAAMVERHRQEGLSEEAARRRAFLDCLSQVSLAGVGGALSGGVMGGTVRGANYLSGAWNQVQSAGAAGTTGQNHTASTEQAGEYRANRPQNVELPNVPIINLSMQSVADMNGGVLPQTGNALRKDAIARARIRLGLDKNSAAYIPASNVTRNGDEYVLKITKASLNKMLSPSQGDRIPAESIVILDNLERIANNGVYFRSEGDRKVRDQIAGYDHLMTTVYIDNQPYVVDMRVRVYDDTSGGENRLYYFTPEEIVTTKKVEAEPPTVGRHATNISSEVVSTSFPIISDSSAGGNPQSARNRTGVTAVGDEYLQQALDEAWQGADGPSVRGPQEDGIQSRGATAVWEAAAVPNSSAGSGQRILEEGWRDEAPSVRGPEENGVHNLERLQLLDSAENAGYDESTVWEGHRELDQDGNPVYAVTRREANIQPEDLRALRQRQRETAKRLGLEEKESASVANYIQFTFYMINKRLYTGTLQEKDRPLVTRITAALRKFPTYEGRTYRNLKFDTEEAYNAFLAKYAVGRNIVLEAFTSASKQPNGYPLFGNGVVHLVLDGGSGRDIADTFGIPRQQEVIYLPGTRINIQRVTIANDGNPLIFAQEVLSDGVGRDNGDS